MPYVQVLDFRGGLDRRKSIVTLQAGALWVGDNVVLTRGNEIEKRRAFAATVTLPAGTIGLATTATNVYVFGTGANPGVGGGVLYQQLTPPAGVVVSLEDYDLFNGRIYAVIHSSDGKTYHFYDGVLVTSWVEPTGLNARNGPVNYLSPNPRASATNRGSPVLTLGNRMYAGFGRLLFLSALGHPDFWTPGDTGRPGAAIVELSNQSGTGEDIVGLAVYQGNLAVFMRDTIQIWRVDPDPTKLQLLQVLSNIGALAPRSVMSFGDSDVFFLSDTGLRSLRARDSSNNAITSDIGTPIDLLLHQLREQFPNETQNARSMIEPDSGRYWLSIEKQIYVFTFFPGSKVSAWTRLLSNVAFTDLETLGDVAVLRSGDVLYTYDNSAGAYGSDYLCEVTLPMLDAGDPSTFKNLEGFDIVCYGAWAARLGTDAANPDNRELIATIDKPSYGMERIAVTGYGTHFGINLRHQAAGPASLASLLLHFARGEND
jgi:hypothetical protein